MAYVGKITDTNGTTGPVGSTLYGTCSTAAGTVEKVVVLAEFDKLITGVTVHVKMTNSNTASNPTLNVNSTGAKYICRNGTTKVGTTEGTSWVAGAMLSFTYDGTNWVMNDSCSFPLAHTHPDQDIKWGTANVTGSYNFLDGLMNQFLSPNRFAGAKAAGITIEYSNDAGSTWTTYPNLTDSQKSNIFTNRSTSVRIGGPTSVTPTVSANSQLRITVNTSAAQIYTTINKIHIYISTSYSQNCKVTIKAATHGDPTNFSKTICNNHPISGWSGWNVVAGSFTTYGNTDAQYQYIQFTFTHTGTTEGKETSGLQVTSIMGFGGVGWTCPSSLAQSGHVYSFDGLMRTTFPNTITILSGGLTVYSGGITVNGNVIAENVHINTLFGSLDSSVTAVTQTPLDNSTKVATTAYVDSLVNRYGRANYNQAWPDPDPTNVWARVAHCTVEVTSASQNLVRRTTFLVSQRLNDNSNRAGILTVGSTTNAANDTSLEASWLVADPGIDPENYVVVSTDTNVSSTTRTSNIELWVKWTSGNEYILFKPLIEHIIGATRIVWTFDEPTASDGQATYTVGTTTVVSSLATLKNDISGNAATATNATNADNLKPDTINPSSATTYYPLFQTSGTTSAKKAYYNTGLSYITKTGTSSEAGLARLSLGHGGSTASTSDKGGEIVMYSTAQNQYTVTLKPAELSSSNKTLTLPNKTGTVAVTSDIPNINRGGILYFSSAGAKWGRVASIVTTSTTTYVMLLSVSQGLGNETSTNHYKAAGILQMACNTSSAGTINSNNNSLMWLVAGGNISSSNFVLVGYNNSKYGSDGKTITTQSGSAVFELWVKNTANYHVWAFKPLQENLATTFGEYFTFYNPRNADAVDTVPTGTINKVSGFFTPVTS